MTTPYKYKLLPMEKVFRDPVHNYIHVQHQVILDLINSKRSPAITTDQTTRYFVIYFPWRRT